MNPKMSRHSIFVPRAAWLALFQAFVGCNAQTEDNFTNPPPGPPPTCSAVPALVGCGAGSVSYACTSDRPDDGDTDLVCDQGVPGASAGDTVYCCAPYGQWASECVPATGVMGCGAQSFGFSCTGSISPDQVDLSLVCSAALAGDGGAADYCCTSFDQSAAICRCSSFDDDAGVCGSGPTPACASGAIGFDCAPGHTPTEANALLDCIAPDGGAPGSYCCRTP